MGATTGIATEYATGKHVYWTHPTGIGRANFDGTGVEQNLVTGLDNPLAVAVNDDYVYWADQYHYYVDVPSCCNGLDGYYTIGRAKLDGTGVERTFITGLEDLPHGIAVEERLHLLDELRPGQHRPLRPRGGPRIQRHRHRCC